jgi:hypothetical protein
LPHTPASIVAIVFDSPPEWVPDLRRGAPRWKVRNLVLIFLVAAAVFLAVVYTAVEMVSS